MRKALAPKGAGRRPELQQLEMLLISIATTARVEHFNRAAGTVACRQPVRWERGMRKKNHTHEGWKRPRIERLGVIKDVAGAQGAGVQAAGTKT